MSEMGENRHNIVKLDSFRFKSTLHNADYQNDISHLNLNVTSVQQDVVGSSKQLVEDSHSPLIRRSDRDMKGPIS